MDLSEVIREHSVERRALVAALERALRASTDVVTAPGCVERVADVHRGRIQLASEILRDLSPRTATVAAREGSDPYRV